MITALWVDQTSSILIAEAEDDAKQAQADSGKSTREGELMSLMLSSKARLQAHRTCACMAAPPQFEGNAAALLPNINTTRRQFPVTMITVCDKEAGKLKASLRCNKKLVDKTIIITSAGDKKTQQLCRDEGITCHITNAMTKGGAKFNKGRAIHEVQKSLHSSPGMANSFVMLVDADICLPETIWSTMPPQPAGGVLYSAVDRCMFPSPEAFSAGWPALQGHWLSSTLGMFQSYVAGPSAPLYPEDSPTAAKSDYEYALLFPQIATVPIFLLHMGIAEDRGRDWLGYKGNEARWEDAMPPPPTTCPCCVYPARKAWQRQ